MSRGPGRFEFFPLREEDLPFLLSVRNECRSFLHDDREFSLEDARAWFRTKKPVFFVIRHEGEKIGYFRTSDHVGGSLMVGADLARAYRGKGLGHDAYKAFFAFIKERLGVSLLKLEVLSSNLRAKHLYDKLGFRETSRLLAACSRDGQLVDNVMMELKL